MYPDHLSCIILSPDLVCRDESEPEKIPDPDAEKPEGWLDDELELIPDEDAEKPADWDDDMDGEWEAPMVSNPACEEAPGCGEWTRPMIKNPKHKGKWRPPMISNPDYKGKWTPRLIPNPKFFEDKEPYKMTPIVSSFSCSAPVELFLLEILIVDGFYRVLLAWSCGPCQMTLHLITSSSQMTWRWPSSGQWTAGS